MSAESRRAAYRAVAVLIDSMTMEQYARFSAQPGVLDELRHIATAMRLAGSVADEPGVEEHVSGSGKAPEAGDA